MHQGFVLSPLFFAIAVNVITEDTREGFMNTGDLVLMSEGVENLKEKFLKWKKAFASKGLKVNLKKTKVMASSFIGKVLKE